MVVGNKLLVTFAILYFVDIGSAASRDESNANVPGVLPCDSPIYCYGELLRTVQLSQIYNDSKTFVDMKLKLDPNTTLQRFAVFMEKYDSNPTPAQVQTFVNDNFDPDGSELKNWVPPDWHASPKFLKQINDPNYKAWATDLHALWKQLGRKMIPDVVANQELYSFIPVPNGFIVPGGRFREYYYWDTYWIIRGLLYSELFQTVKGILRNFLSLVARYGFVPNGGRLYYLARTQPPLLTGMVESYIATTSDFEFMKEALPLLEREFEFFMTNRTVYVKGHLMAHYGVNATGPRPESYLEDYTNAQNLTTAQAQNALFSEFRAAAESGMDFSSRWFMKDGSNRGTLDDIKCRSIVPVELNSILFKNAIILAEFYKIAKNPKKAAKFKRRAKALYDAVQAVLWNEEAGTWFDYDLLNRKPRKYFVPTNLAPLWTGCFNKNDRALIATRTLNYIRKIGLDDYPGGVPNTLLHNTGQQWDYPNVWPPMQYILVESLLALKDKVADGLALSWTARWIRSNYEAYNSTKVMYEKYSATVPGTYGGGGEYTVQAGFGWSNGVDIEFLAKKGKVLSSYGEIGPFFDCSD